MLGQNSNNCETNCQCSGLITDKFRINSGNNATKRKQEEALSHNYKIKIKPHSIDFKQSPMNSPNRRVLGEIQNTPRNIFDDRSPKINPLYITESPKSNGLFKNSPVMDRLRSSPNYSPKSPLAQKSPLQMFQRSPLQALSPRSTMQCSRNFVQSPGNTSSRYSPPLQPLESPLLNTRCLRRSPSRKRTKISKIFEERTKFKMANKENCESKFNIEEDAQDCVFKSYTDKAWSSTKLDFTDAIQHKSQDIYVPDNTLPLETEFEELQDLEEEFESSNFEQCTKYEIISTDSPDIISRGRASTRKVNSRHLSFGAPLSDTETSTSFNRPQTSRVINFEDSFEFTSPPLKKNISVKKSLKFTETPNKLTFERSRSSIGSMSMSPCSSKRFPSESTSMESGFISELEEPFLEIEEISNSPKISNFNELLSGQIKESFTEKLRPAVHRSLSFNPEPTALFSISESPESSKCKKRICEEMEGSSKRRKSNESPKRPVLQRAFSESNAYIMSAMAKSSSEELIGDFSLPYALPCTEGNHSDLKSITCDTLAALLGGEFDHSVRDFKVIDCRYPYEFEGGHIVGAENLYTRDLVQRLLAEPPQPRRSVLVFHCEFSLERGPTLCRYLRAADRALHRDAYPALRHPELYLLHQGYRAFHELHPRLCHPRGYTAMLHPLHARQLRRHRSAAHSNRLR